jgi:MFS family permease
MTTECVFVLIPLTLPYDYGLDSDMVSIFLCVSAFLVLPMSFIMIHYFQHYQERKIIRYLLLLAAVSCLFLINYFWVVGFPQFSVAFCILFICSNLLESVSSSLLAKIVPQNLQVGFMNTGLIIIIATTIGKFVGNCLVTLFSGFGYENIGNATYLCFFMFYGLLFILLVWRYKDLRVKAISRILKKKNL